MNELMVKLGWVLVSPRVSSGGNKGAEHWEEAAFGDGAQVVEFGRVDRGGKWRPRWFQNLRLCEKLRGEKSGDHDGFKI